MIKQLTQNLDLGFFAQTSLVLFFLAFVSICLWALFRSKREIKSWADMPFDDPNEAVLQASQKATETTTDTNTDAPVDLPKGAE